MESFETPRNLFQLHTAQWKYFQNGYHAEINLVDGIYEGYIGAEFIDSTLDFNVLCSLLITEIRRRESEFTDRIGNLSGPGKSNPRSTSGG